MEQCKIQHPLFKQLFHFIMGRRFDPGAQAEVYVPSYGNPVHLVRGPGRYFAKQFQSLQPAQVRFLPQRLVNGVGGVQAGYIVSQPLLDPSQLQNPAVE